MYRSKIDRKIPQCCCRGAYQVSDWWRGLVRRRLSTPWNIEAYLTFDVIVWYIKTRERHWWRHNCDSNRRPLSLALRYDRVTQSLYGDLGQNNVIAGILKLWKRFRMSLLLFEHGVNSLPLVCFRGSGNLSTLSIAIPRLAFGSAWYCDAACW